MALADAHLELLDPQAESQLELVEFSVEPDCWRRYIDGAGTRQVLKPDAHLVTVPRIDGMLSEFEDHTYLEVDRGTESIPTVLGQCFRYEDYRRAGRDQERLGIFPQIVWLTPDERRADRIAQAILSHARLTHELYKVVSASHLLHLLSGGSQ